jgi:serine/threonine protein kinase/tetratricopeptide (TPR) repeat protein
MTQGLSFGHFRVATHLDGTPIELGRGAMGVTYRAYDERLRIDVALKVIRPSQTEDAIAQALFLREARAAVRVHHANVASVVFLNDTPGKFYYAMEFVAGESLFDWLRRRGALPWDLALGFAAQIARGLAAIHGERIVHRDLKPANIMIVAAKTVAAKPTVPPEANPDAWLVKIIDFGLARVFAGDALSSALEPHTIGFRGTALYASPEQCEENTAIDGRSDQYALGCILWEMLVGTPPFSGRNHRELLNRHVASPPPRDRIRHLPAHAQAVVIRMLSKDPTARFADDLAAVAALEAARTRPGPSSSGDSIADPTLYGDSIQTPNRQAEAPPVVTIRAARRRKRIAAGFGALALAALIGGLAFFTRPKTTPSTTATAIVAKNAPADLEPRPPPNPAISRKSVAVLPFENFSSDKENEYFADGVHEDVLTNLSKVRDLKVISRTSVMGYRGKMENLRQIAGELGVASIVEGSVRRSGSKVRVSAQLIDATTDQHIWAENFDGDMTDIFAIQSKIAQDIAKALEANLTPQEKVSIELQPTQNQNAYEFYSRAREVMRGQAAYNPNEWERAVNLLEQAIAADPNFALAYAELSLALTGRIEMLERTPEKIERARWATENALRLQPSLPETRLAVARFMGRVESKYAAAFPDVLAVCEQYPNNADAALIAGDFFCRLGRWSDAELATRRLIELSPRDSKSITLAFRTFGTTRMWQELETIMLAFAKQLPEDRLAPQWAALARFNLTLDLADYNKAIRAMAPSLDPLDTTETDFLNRDFKAVLAKIEARSGQSMSEAQDAYSIHLQRGWAHTFLGDRAAAEAAFLDATRLLGARVTREPTNPYAHAALAEAYAGLGRRDEALESARQATTLLPENSDAYRGPAMTAGLALVLAWTGDVDKAAELLEHLLSIPSQVTVAELRYDPHWDPLRGNPRFQALIADPKQKASQ